MTPKHSLLFLQGLAAIALVSCLATGCKPKPSNEASTPAQSTPPEPSPVVQIDGLNLGQVSDADRAWESLERALEAPPTPPEWEAKEPSPDQIATFERTLGVAASESATKAKAFYEQYPTHTKAGEARDRELELLNVAVQLGQTNLIVRLEKLEATQLEKTDLSPEERMEVRMRQLQRQVKLADDHDSTSSVSIMDKGVRAMLKEFPNRPEPLTLLVRVAEGWISAGDPEKAKGIFKELKEQSLPEEMKDQVKSWETKIDRLGKPIDLKFVALDGKNIDLASLVGKVVLLQFWATWSAASLEELAGVKSAYEQLHDKGLEVIGVSLDRERNSLEQFVSDQGIVWSQSFEGETNSIAERFSISSVPTLWLLDKHGKLRDINARTGLTARIKRLLDEP